MFERLLGSWQVVRDGTVGLLYRDGVFQREILPGRVRVGPRQNLVMVDVREQTVVVSGQEVLSSDGFQPKLSAIATFTVVDAHASVRSRDKPVVFMVSVEVQLALRAVAATRPAEDLAKSAREDIGAELSGLVAAGCTGMGVQVGAVRVRDVILPAELRRLLTGVERARREGLAVLERAHAEQASLRALANAARMLRNNPELQNLRLLQAIGSGAPTTIVLGTPAGIVPLREGPPDPP